MDIQFHKNFKKGLDRLPGNNQERFRERLVIFVNNAFDPVLNNHTLKGKYKNCRSINVAGDLRAIYTIKNDTIIFLEIGTHSELYG